MAFAHNIRRTAVADEFPIGCNGISTDEKLIDSIEKVNEIPFRNHGIFDSILFHNLDDLLGFDLILPENKYFKLQIISTNKVFFHFPSYTGGGFTHVVVWC